MMRDVSIRTRNRVNRVSWRRSLLLALAALAALGLSACGSSEEQARPAPPVTVANPTIETIQGYFVLTGSTRAFETADIVARVAGTLESVEFEPASTVEAGQLLFTIEDTAYRAARDMAKATVAAAKADLARAETELKRVEKASQSRAVSEMDVDRARADRDMADAAVDAAEASLIDAEKDLSYTRVKSPIDGAVSRNLVDRGNLVGQSGPTLLTRINHVEPIYVYFYAPESLVLQMLKGPLARQGEDAQVNQARAKVQLANETDFPHEGYVDFVDNRVDPTTGTIEMRIRLENKDHALFPGLFVRVKLLGGDIPDAVLIPATAIGTDLGGKYVLVVGEENIVQQAYVEPGLAQEGDLVHIRSGLEGDETIIVNGLMYARPGLPVQPMTAEQMAAMKQQAAQQSK